MARASNVDLRDLLQELGSALGHQLRATILARVAVSTPDVRELRRAARDAANGAAADALGDAACKISGCGDAALSLGLCDAHYNKGRRLGLALHDLGAAQLRRLARDGRAKPRRK